MKGQSDTKPESFLKSRGKTQVLYNIISKVVTDEHGTRTIWEYDYVEIDGTVTKTKVIEAMQKADADVEDDTSEVVPEYIAAQHSDAKSELALSDIAQKTYMQADAYINANVTDLASARTFLKKLTRVVLAILKRSE